MDFSLQRESNRRIKYYDSGKDSSIQLIFLPGAFNPELWRQQFRYFSKSFRTISFDLWKQERSYRAQVEVLDSILEKDEITNAVLIGYGLGNPLAQELEHREDVAATVITGPAERFPLVPRRLYNSVWKLAGLKPKLAKKLFFSEKTDYRVVRQFMKDIEAPSYEEFREFSRHYSLRKPVKNCMVIHAENDRFSSKDYARRLKPDASVSLIKSAGSFSFYEKPQEYNKALLDFLKNMEMFVESREITQTQKKNRSLKEFELEKTVMNK
ncbi:MAG: alpha/beta fold hydrolase [Candidatus Nanohaloarchaea archaeon]